MILDLKELSTLLILVRERRAYVYEHTQTPHEGRVELLRLEDKLAEMLEDADDEVDETENDGLRGVNAFEARTDGSLVLYATMPDGDGEPIRVEPHRVGAALAACGDALARKPSTR